MPTSRSVPSRRSARHRAGRLDRYGCPMTGTEPSVNTLALLHPNCGHVSAVDEEELAHARTRDAERSAPRRAPRLQPKTPRASRAPTPRRPPRNRHPSRPSARQRGTTGISAAIPARPRAGSKPRPWRAAGRGGATPARPRSTAQSSRTFLVLAALAHFARLLVSSCGIEHVIVGVLVVVPHPRHRECQPVFVAALRNQIEEVIRSDQRRRGRARRWSRCGRSRPLRPCRTHLSRALPPSRNGSSGSCS